jgi:monoamine oxidase
MMPEKPELADVIVIGGGVAGLAAARELSRGRIRVILLEARPRMGGRVDTRRIRGWPFPLEMGAEFIHGGNADLWRLLRLARVRVQKIQERHWLGRSGKITNISDLDARIARVTRKIKPSIAGTRSFSAFFRRYPAHVSPEDWMLARSFVEGFEAAPLDRISALSLCGETMDEPHQYKVPEGYDRVVHALMDACSHKSVKLRTDAAVQLVRWHRGFVEVTGRTSAPGELIRYSARAAIVTLPLGVLKARTGRGSVRFRPELKRKESLIRRMQMGHVVRLVIRFRASAWRRLWPKILQAERRGGFGFVHSQVEGVPVWWSLSNRPVLVGWAGGPAAKALLGCPERERRKRALRSLAEMLNVSPADVGKAVLELQSWDWTHDPFTRGAYSFTAAGEDMGAAQLRSAVRDTIFFAGEATAEGDEVGTVHGALSSGIRAAKEVRRALKAGRGRARSFRMRRPERS